MATHDVLIDDPQLTQRGFIEFSLPLNGGIGLVITNTDNRKTIYSPFSKHYTIDDTVLSLQNKLTLDGTVEDDTARNLIAYIRNSLIQIQEDYDLPFFKTKNGNGNDSSNGNGNGNGKEAKAQSKPNRRQKQQQQRQGDKAEEKPEEITSKSPVYKQGDNLIAEAVFIGADNGLMLPYWVISSRANSDSIANTNDTTINNNTTPEISIQPYIDICDEISKKHLYPPKWVSYLYEPYKFTSGDINQLQDLITHVQTNEAPDTLFSEINGNGIDMLVNQIST